jgi:hypothetical protein
MLTCCIILLHDQTRLGTEREESRVKRCKRLRHACGSSNDDHIKSLAQLTLQRADGFTKLTTQTIAVNGLAQSFGRNEAVTIVRPTTRGNAKDEPGVMIGSSYVTNTLKIIVLPQSIPPPHQRPYDAFQLIFFTWFGVTVS